MKSEQSSWKKVQWKKNTTYGTIEPPQRNKIKLSKLFSCLGWTHRLKLTLGVMCAILHGSSRPLVAFLFGVMTNNFILAYTGQHAVNGDRFEFSIRSTLLVYVFVGVGTLISATFQVMTFESVSNKIIFDLKMQFVQSILVQNITWHERLNTNIFVSTLTTNMDAIKEGTGLKFSLLIQNGASLVFGLALSFYCSWELSVLLIVLTPFLAIGTTLNARLRSAAVAGEQERLHAATKMVEQALSSLPTVIAFNGQHWAIQNYNHALKEASKGNERNINIAAIANGGLYFLIYLSYALTVGLGCFLFRHNHIQPGFIFTVIFIGMICASALGNLLTAFSALDSSKISAISVFEVIESLEELSTPTRSHLNQTFNGHLQFLDVEFSYPKSEIPVFRQLTLDAIGGSRVGIVGESECGKSTIVNLILRMYDPTHGSILLDGMDMQEFPPEYVRSQMGILHQNPRFFSGTIAQNILMGGSGDFVQASRLAQIEEFISLLPQKYETLLGENGFQLSAPQRQGLALARALISNPRFLILDEPTSDLDSESERQFLKTLTLSSKGRTTITLSRHSKVVQLCDIIYFMKDGEIVESGRHELLMLRRRKYFEYVQLEAAQGMNAPVPAPEQRVEEAGIGILKATPLEEMDSISDRDLWRMLLQIMKQHWPVLILGLVAAALMGLLPAITAYIYAEIIRVLVDSIAQVDSGGLFWAVGFVLLGIATAAVTIIRTRSLGQSNELIGRTLRFETFRTTLSLPLSYFDADENRSEGIRKTLLRDVGILRSAYTLRIIIFLVVAVTLLSCLILAFISSWKLALVMTLTSPLLVLSKYVETLTLRSSRNQGFTRSDEDAALQVAKEGLENIKTVQSLVAEANLLNNYKKHLQQNFRKMTWRSVKSGLTFGVSQTLEPFVYPLAFYLGAIWLDMQVICLPDFYKSFLAILFGALSVGEVLSLIPDYSKSKESGRSIFNLMETSSPIDPFCKAGARPELEGALTFSNVHFSYPNGNKVLDGITFQLEANKTMLLLGFEGAGKSTIAKLVERFYDVNIDGAVLIDDWDVRDLNVTYLRCHIGFVEEAPKMFEATIWENIDYGAVGSVPSEAIIEAARLANAHDFIVTCPQGYETPILEQGGFQLSSGQKLRIGIARALIRNPKILIINLPRSLNESKSEEMALQIAIHSARQNRTCIILSSQIWQYRSADVIGVLHDRRIVEFGSHEQLLERKGIYFKLSQI